MAFQIAIGSRIRKSPFFDKTVEDGVSGFSVYNHMYMPTGYGDPHGEYDRLINGVSMWDVSVERQVELSGPDAEKLARILTPRNLDGYKIGQGRYVPLCDHRGTIINDPVLLPIAENRFWLSIADSDILLWARAIAAERQLDVAVNEPDVSPLAVQGPKAVDVVSSMFGDRVRELKYFGFFETEIENIPLLVARSGWSKQGGYELYLKDSNYASELWDLVKQYGHPFGIGPGTPNYIERIESGLISYGADTDDLTNPFELGLGKFVDLDQPVDFVGKDALKKITQTGPKRKMVGFKVLGNLSVNAQQKWSIFDGERSVGYISATCYSPRVGENIGIGLIEVEFAEKNVTLTAASENGPIEVKICTLPFKV